MTNSPEFTLAELLVVACAEAYRNDEEWLATGIGPLPKLATGLAKLTFAPQIMMTDGECMLIEDPIPLGPRGDYEPKFSGWMPYSRVFDTVWSGKRHAIVTPVQVDRYAQGNIAALGGDFKKPKVQLLGVRGFPGNSISHRNSMFLPSHTKRTFIEGEVDVVASIGFNPKRWPEGTTITKPDIGIIVTNLCVMDFKGPNNAARVISLHPGVTFEEVQTETGFPLIAIDNMPTTPAPTAEQLAIINKLDPHNIRATILKGNPAGIRS